MLADHGVKHAVEHGVKHAVNHVGKHAVKLLQDKFHLGPHHFAVLQKMPTPKILSSTMPWIST